MEMKNELKNIYGDSHEDVVWKYIQEFLDNFVRTGEEVYQIVIRGILTFEKRFRSFFDDKTHKNLKSEI